jgi:hypothetical protein
VLVCVLWVAPSALATSSVVTNTDDSGAGSLRQAVTAANNDAAADTITFAPGVTGQISLTGGELTITHDLTITGPGATALVLNGNNATTILQVSGSTTVAVSRLGFASGRSSSSGEAGAIQNAGSLSVSDSDFGFNTATAAGPNAGGGAIQNTGTLTVTDSSFGSNAAGGAGSNVDLSGIGTGGAIDNAGTSLTVSGSTFAQNTAGGNGGGGVDSGQGRGGAIFSSAPMTITDSTFTANQAGGTLAGGGLSGEGFGGAISVGASSAILVNDTIDANSLGSASLATSGAGIDSTGGTVTAQSTIVSGNTGGANCRTSLAITSDHSLEGPAGQTSCGFDLASADPLLQPLADNGGPTQTQALSTGSPAIGAVPLASCRTTTDQRGLPRPEIGDSRCDVGAYEVQKADLTATVTDDVNGAVPFGRSWTWKLHIANAGGSPASFASGQTILLDDLPAAGLAYGTPAVATAGGVSGTVSCQVASAELSCAPSGGAVSLPTGSAVDVSVAVTPSAAGTYSEPRAGGACAVDPFSVIDEANETNNACSDSVTVAQAPAPPAPGSPSARIISPAPRGTYTQGQTVRTSFSCAEGTNGPGLASCTDSNHGAAPAGRLDTATLGAHVYTVTATSRDGDRFTADLTYRVVKRLTVVIGTARATVAGGRAPVHLTCSGGAAGATCRGRLSLILKIGSGKRAKVMTLGSSSYSVRSGARGKTLSVRLTAGGLTRLQHAAGRHLKVIAVLTLKSRPTIRPTLILRLPAKRRR